MTGNASNKGNTTLLVIPNSAGVLTIANQNAMIGRGRYLRGSGQKKLPLANSKTTILSTEPLSQIPPTLLLGLNDPPPPPLRANLFSTSPTDPTTFVRSRIVFLFCFRKSNVRLHLGSGIMAMPHSVMV